MLERMKGEIGKALPRHLTPERMIRVALTAVQRTPELQDCDPLSIVGCVVQSSQLGLELDSVLGHAYMVPYKNKRNGHRKEAQLIVGYKGFLSLARRSGDVVLFAAHVVHENDHFVHEYGLNPVLEHRPNLVDPGQPIAAYSVLKLRDGSGDCEVIPWGKILQAQQQYGERQSSPWNTHLEEMARKTAIRALAKRAPISVEIQTAANLDSMAEAGVDQGLSNLLPVTRTQALAARLTVPQSAGVAVPEPTADELAEESRQEWEAQKAEREGIQGEGE